MYTHMNTALNSSNLLWTSQVGTGSGLETSVVVLTQRCAWTGVLWLAQPGILEV